MPSGQFNTVVISVSDILPLDKGHYISVSLIAGYDILSIFRDPDLPLELYIRILQQTHTAFRRSAA